MMNSPLKKMPAGHAPHQALRAFLNRHFGGRRAFAESVGITRPYLSQIENGHRVPSLDVAVAIQRATGGAVPADIWVADRSADGGA